MAVTPLGGEVIPFRNDAPASAAASKPAEDPRVTSALRWCSTVASGLTLAVVLGMSSIIFGVRDNQIVFKALLDNYVRNVQNHESSIKRMDDEIREIRVQIGIMKQQR